MSLLNKSCVQLEFGAAGESTSSSDFTQLLCGSVHVGPCTAVALTSSSHTTTSSLCCAHSPCQMSLHVRGSSLHRLVLLAL